MSHFGTGEHGVHNCNYFEIGQHSAAFHLGLHCLSNIILTDFQSKLVNRKNIGQDPQHFN